MSNFEILNIVSKQKSWGRNEIRNLETVGKYELDKLSSFLDKPVMSDSDVIYQIILNFDNDFYNIKSLYLEYKDVDKNISKDLALILFVNSGANYEIYEDFNSRLRYSNSRRHLCRKLVYSYLKVRFEIDYK